MCWFTSISPTFRELLVSWLNGKCFRITMYIIFDICFPLYFTKKLISLLIRVYFYNVTFPCTMWQTSLFAQVIFIVYRLTWLSLPHQISFFKKYFIVYAVTLSQFSPFVPLPPALPHSHGRSPHLVPACGFDTHILLKLTEQLSSFQKISPKSLQLHSVNNIFKCGKFQANMSLPQVLESTSRWRPKTASRTSTTWPAASAWACAGGPPATSPTSTGTPEVGRSLFRSSVVWFSVADWETESDSAEQL